MRALERLWWRHDEPAWAEAWLWPLSLGSMLFRVGAALRARAGQPARAPVPVISVGNLAVGGAGKTPVAMLVCERLHARGLKPALLSRGYGRTSRDAFTLVCAGAGPLCDVDAAGDEPLLFARRCPWLLVLAGADRAQLAREARARGADVLVLDDGLQQRALASDLELIVVDAQSLLGNGRRLPRGPLREGTEAFARVGARGLLWLSNARQPERGSELQRLLDAARSAGVRGPVESAAAPIAGEPLRGSAVFLLAGIARPERFEESVRALGAEIRGRAFFADHHRFSEEELARVRKSALGAGAGLIVTTEKDAARLSAPEKSGTPSIVPLAIELEILRGSPLLDGALDALLAPVTAGAAARDPA